MINKQSLWFITLFSLIIILGIYYVTIPEESLSVFSNNSDNIEEVIEVNESDIIVAMKVEEEEKILTAISEAQDILLDTSSTIQDKNNAYINLRLLNNQKIKAQEIEKLIKDKYNSKSFVKIEGSKISITMPSKDQGRSIANEIINTAQSLYDTQMYITVKFQK